LAELHFDGAQLRRRRDDLREPFEAERAVGVPAAEVPGADLPYELAAVEMVTCQPAFTGGLQASRQRGAPVQ